MDAQPPSFLKSRPKVKDALAVLMLRSMPRTLADLRHRCTGIFQGPDGDTWISDSMQAAQRHMAMDAYRFLQARLEVS
jgi:hypothetical protein